MLFGFPTAAAGVTPTVRIDQVHEKAAVEGQLDHAALFHHVAQLGGFGMHQWSRGGHLHHFGNLAYLQGEVDGSHLVDRQIDASSHLLFESRRFRREDVIARTECRHGVPAGGIAQCGEDVNICARIGDGDLHAGNGGGARIPDYAGDGAGIGLPHEAAEDSRTKEQTRIQL